jgi:hypothetical protein
MNSDIYYLRSSCVLYLNYDIIGIAESHLLGDSVLELDGYRWYGFNRAHIHKKLQNLGPVE